MGLLQFRKKLKAERELQPWIAKDDVLVQKMWRINQRIIKLIVELMRNHNTPESLVIMASALDLLRATDGMLVDGEACTLPQLERGHMNREVFKVLLLVLGWTKGMFSIFAGVGIDRRVCEITIAVFNR